MSVFPPDTRSIFQLTPSRRATNADIITHLLFLFQLTPSRRATRCCDYVRRQQINFNSRPHGGRQKRADKAAERKHFNSRPHGGRPSYPESSSLHQNFNSRPHGGRHLRSAGSEKCRRFQLTPSRRATRKELTVMPIFFEDFNSRPHGGRRQI